MAYNRNRAHQRWWDNMEKDESEEAQQFRAEIEAESKEEPTEDNCPGCGARISWAGGLPHCSAGCW